MSDRPLRVVVAPDSFGGALASPGVADAIAAGWTRARPSDILDLAPMADGGEGTLEALSVALGDRAERRSVPTVDALGRPVSADWLLIDDGEAAFVEMATASGLARLAVEERTPANARVASSRGTGDLLRAALDAGARSIALGLGGSATTDGGSGMLVALGARLLDESGEELPPGGAALARLARIEVGGLDHRLGEVAMMVASDVTNTLCGPAGAAATYGPQKGCDEWAVQELDRALLHWGQAVEQASGRSVADQPGAGAAGGTTSALLGFTNAVIRPGVEVVAEAVGLTELLAAADLVITGEGQADEQTLSGKAAMGVAALARGNATPVILLCGGLGPGAAALDASGAFAVVQPIADRPMRLAASMRDTERLLANAAERVAHTVQVGLLLAEPDA
ncbi:MAG TPA: glycerate kinase [Candidatus Limnocylindria bacterium]|nr:glycerate kinase [Candidatus Limnocylindria bacterium]